MQLARSSSAAIAYQLVTDLQRRMVDAQQAVARETGADDHFVEVRWLRDDGRHGGGSRWGIADSPVFDRASVNVSQVHYDDDPDKRLSSATALSTIIHPRHPHAPSVHVHVSWTEMRDGRGSWRIMADLNPSIADTAFSKTSAERFGAALREVAPAVYEHAARQGDRYFEIPALGQHRGVSHYYLEQHATADADADLALARAVGAAAIDTHASVVAEALRTQPAPAADEIRPRRER